MEQVVAKLQKSNVISGQALNITGSKSESNRALILKALYPEIQLANLSNSDDTTLLEKALKSTDNLIDINHAGTAMRFLTAYLSTQGSKEVVLTGSPRMKERPIAVLVKALKQLGADIQYAEEAGYPPLRIKGTYFQANAVELNANISSQYISALLLIAPSLPNGLRINLLGNITSRPYIEMTLALLRQVGVRALFNGNEIQVDPLVQLKRDCKIVIESDWSSASYYYSLMALSEIGTKVYISHYFKNSLQGDSVLVEIYETFGVKSEFLDNQLIISKAQKVEVEVLELDLSDAPDIAQTIAVTCFGLGLSCRLTGLHTLKIKETDRLEALKAELSKLGASIRVTENTLTLERSEQFIGNQSIDTYHDHRMAMAFAPLALIGPIRINDPGVVSKSYPTFWEDLSTLGVDMK